MTDQTDVAVVGGGVAGLTAATYTARHEFETRVFDTGASILRRNAHLENVPGFPAGVDARLWLDLLAEQADRAGAARIEAEVTAVTDTEGGAFRVETTDEHLLADRVILATKNDASYLDVDGVGVIDRGKTFLDTDERGRTGVDGCYAAGRLAEKPHQAAVAAGHGAEVAVTLLEDADVGFYHDWVAPDGYFTDRGRDLPPGCEEIDREEYEQRREQAHRTMVERFSDPDLDPPETHPSLQK